MTDFTILDGGMGRELERSGAPFRQPEWSALALMEAPEAVRAVHDRFVAAGAQVITTNSYALVPFHIGQDRFDASAEKLADLAGRLARAAADGGQGVRVAGSIPPVFGSYRPDLFRADQVQDLLAPLVRGLSPHVDVWLAETQSSLEEAEASARAVEGQGKPVWLSFTLRDDVAPQDMPEPQLRSGQTVADAARLALQVGAGAMLFNCSMPEVMEAALTTARKVLDGRIPLGVYANAFGSQDEDGEANEVISDIRPDMTPAHYCDWASRWTAAGATIIGGCCGIGTEHIHELAGGTSSV